jgi:vacuolar-type H+-ATPase subunit D/Vma8
LKAAQKGHDLLKKKADALNMKFRDCLSEFKQVSFISFVLLVAHLFQKKIQMGTQMKTAGVSVSKINFAGSGNLTYDRDAFQ